MRAMKAPVILSVSLLLLIPLLLLALVLSACGDEATTTTVRAAATTATAASPTTVAEPTTAASVSTTPIAPSTTAAVSATTTSIPPTPTIAGTIAFTTPAGDGDYDICAVNTDGTGLMTLAGGEGCQSYPQWSPDGSRLVFTQSAPGDADPVDVWVMNADGSGKKQLTSKAMTADLGATFHRNAFGTWSPDGKQIALTSWVRYPPERAAILVMNADGSGVHWVTSLDGEAADYFPRWASDGRIYFLRIDKTGHPSAEYRVNPDGTGLELVKTLGDVHYSHLTYEPSPDATVAAFQDLGADRLLVLPAMGAGTPVPLLDPVAGYLGKLAKAAVSWSPDGKALAVAGLYDSGREPFTHVYILNADGSGLSMVPGVDAARDPAWQPK